MWFPLICVYLPKRGTHILPATARDAAASVPLGVVSPTPPPNHGDSNVPDPLLRRVPHAVAGGVCSARKHTPLPPFVPRYGVRNQLTLVLGLQLDKWARCMAAERHRTRSKSRVNLKWVIQVPCIRELPVWASCDGDRTPLEVDSNQLKEHACHPRDAGFASALLPLPVWLPPPDSERRLVFLS